MEERCQLRKTAVVANHAFKESSQQNRISCHAIPETCFDAIGCDQINSFCSTCKCLQGSERKFAAETETDNAKRVYVFTFQKDLYYSRPFFFFQWTFAVRPFAAAMKKQIEDV